MRLPLRHERSSLDQYTHPSSEPSPCTRLSVERMGMLEAKYGLKDRYYENDTCDLSSDRSDTQRKSEEVCVTLIDCLSRCS